MIPVAKSKSQATDEQAAPGWLERLPREAALLVCVGTTLFLLASLISYHANDPGWSSSGTGEPVRNLIGGVGAWIADILLSLVGYVAFFLPWGVFVLGIRLYRGAPDTPAMPWPIRAFAWLALLPSFAALCGLHVGRIADFPPQGAGGIIGQAFSEWLVGFLNPVGASLLLLTVTLATLPLALMFSWVRVLDAVGGIAMTVWARSRAPARDAAQDEAFAVVEPQPEPTDVAADNGSWLRRRKTPQMDVRQPPAVVETQLDLPGLPPEPEAERPAPRRREPRVNAAPLMAELGLDDGEPSLTPLTAEPDEPAEVASTPIPAARPRPPRKPARAEPISVPPFDGDPIPPIDLLDPPKPSGKRYTADELDRLSRDVERHLGDFGIKVQAVNAMQGPVITRFELQPAPGVKGAQITNLSNDLARSLSVSRVRVIEVIEGKPYVGLEIPNQKREMVYLREILDSSGYHGSASPLTMALGKDIAGNPVSVDMAKMPHLLVAGTTGAGKSVAINVMILSMLYKATPQQVRFIFVDPKMLELSVYADIPHLLTPVVTDMKDAANALRWSVAEMERRYRLMTAMGVRNLAGLNRKVEDAEAAGEPIPDPTKAAPELFDEVGGEPVYLKPLPHIVIVIDELADMMMVVGKKVEELIARIAQKARAAGIHLIVATQRPSVDVITGLIKANIPSRIAFQVASRIDSRTILDMQGAETLLGHGDMLYRPIGASNVARVHGAFVDDHEVHKVVAYLKQTGEPDYIEDILADEVTEKPQVEGGDDAESDPLYDQAVAMVIETRKASVSWVQRRLKIGYNRAARIVEQMEASGLVGPSGPGGNREILAPGGRD